MKQLQAALPYYKHLEGDLPYEEWKAAGRPCLWVFAIADDHAVIYKDMGNDFVALFEDGQLTDAYDSEIVVGDRYAVSCQDEEVRLFKLVKATSLNQEGEDAETDR